MLLVQEHEDCLDYAPNGLKLVRQKFVKPTQIPSIINIPQELIDFFKLSKQKCPIGQTITSRYNISTLIDWVVEDIKALNSAVFQFTPSQLHIILALMKMMEMNLLIKAIDTPQIHQISNILQDILKQKLLKETKACELFVNQVQNRNCRVVSQNTQKSRDVLLLKRKQIIKDSKHLVSPLTQLDLNCVFSNICLNIRRQIRSLWKQKQQKLKQFGEKLKFLELKLYYLSISTFKLTQSYVKELSEDVLHPQRKITLVYLIHDQKGIQKIYHYLQQAPILILEQDMDLMSEIINKRSKIFKRGQNSRYSGRISQNHQQI